MDLKIVLMIMGGLVGLVLGGEFLVKGASRIAQAAGISALVIGLTIVAFGTSAPELVVSLKAGLSGNSNIAIANVVGSNIFNILLILGVCAIVAPLNVTSQLIRLDVPLMIISSFLVLFFSLNGILSAWEGVILFSMVLGYTFFLIKKSKSESRKTKSEFDLEFGKKDKIATKDILISVAQVIFGLGVLIVGGDWLVEGAIILAKNFGVSDTVIGLTIVAAGTSLPELATSLIATYKGEREIAIGNIVGSNIFNLLSILGLSSIITPGGLNVSSDLLTFDYPIMIGAAVATLPIFFTGFKINRWEGFLFFSAYILYTIYLLLKASSQPAIFNSYEEGLLYFVLPVFGLSLAVISVQAYLQARKK